MIKIDDYHNALEIVCDRITNFPSHLKPSVISKLVKVLAYQI